MEKEKYEELQMEIIDDKEKAKKIIKELEVNVKREESKEDK